MAPNEVAARLGSWLPVRAGAVALVIATAACVPTISEQRGKEHMAALDEGEKHQHHGRLAEAAASYERAAETAERRVDRDESLYRASRVYARMQNFTRALEICDELGAAQPTARRTLRARLDAARYRIAMGQVDDGETALRALIVEEPESAAARSSLRILSEKYVDGATPEDAVSWLDALLEEVGESSISEPIMSMKAEMYIQKGDPDEAVRVLEDQIVKFPYPQGGRWDDALARLADLAMERQDPKAAIAYLEKMIAVHEGSFILGSYTRPQFSKSALRIARIYRDDIHDNKKAIAAFQHMRSEFPHSSHRDDSMYEEAALRIDTGDKDDGCDLLRDMLKEFDSGTARRSADKLLKDSCP